MATPLIPIKNPALEYLKSHSSTKDFHIQTIGQFFTYLKDSILSLFNSDHKFTHLGSKSISEFNLEHIKTDLVVFLQNPSLNNQKDKDKKGFLAYQFQYLPTQAGILPNFYDTYHSGNLEPNELISQLINYGNKLIKEELNDKEQQNKSSIKKILEEINTEIQNKTSHSTIELRNKLPDVINKLTIR